MPVAILEASTVTTALTSAMGGIANDVMGALGAVLPIALPIVGAGIVIKVGLKIFKRVTNS